MEPKTYTVSVAIPAHNEEETIQELLTHLLRQDCEGFSLREIIVLSDNSTDETVTRAKSVEDARVKVIETPEHFGQNKCQNVLFRMAEGDIVVFLEADMMPHSTQYLSELVGAIIKEEAVCTYGATEPWLNAKGLGSLFYFVESAKLLAYRSYRRGRNIFTCHSGKAVLKAKALNLNWPPDVSEDAYFYLFGRYTIRSVYYARKAVLYYHVPTTITDYLRESVRYLTNRRTIGTYFSPRVIRKEYSLPGPAILDFFGTILHKPHFSAAYTVLLLLSRVLSVFISIRTPTWKTARTTKIKFKTI